MIFIQNKWLLLFINLLLSLLLFLLFASEYQLIDFINFSFYIAAFYFLLFIFLSIMNGRFFDGLVFATRRITRTRSTKKDRDLLQEVENKKLPSDYVNNIFYRLIAFQGITLMGLQLVLLAIYYLR